MASDGVGQSVSLLLGPSDRIRWPRAIRQMSFTVFLFSLCQSESAQFLYLQAETFTQLLLVGATINHQRFVFPSTSQHPTPLLVCACVALLCSNWKLIDLYNALISNSRCSGFCLASPCQTGRVGPSLRQTALVEVLMIGTTFFCYLGINLVAVYIKML